MRNEESALRRLVWAVALSAALGGAVTCLAGELDLEPLDRLSDRWLQAVDPWMTPDEETAYAALRSARAREEFAVGFWRARGLLDEVPGSDDDGSDDDADDDGRLWLEEHARRVEEATWRFARDGRPADLRTDRARALLLAGSPSEVVVFGGCRGRLRPLRVWRYDAAQARAIGLEDDGFDLVFRRTAPGPAGDFRLWSPDEGLAALFEDDALASADGPEDLVDFARERKCFRTGHREEEALRRALEAALPLRALDATAASLPVVDGWWRDAEAGSTGLVDGAGSVSVTFEPIRSRATATKTTTGRSARAVTARIAIELETGGLRRAPGGRIFDRLRLDGEVRQGRSARGPLRDRFERIVLLAGTPPATGRTSIIVERRLSPGPARLRLRLVDARGLALLRDDLLLDVPTADSVTREPADAEERGRRAGVSPIRALRFVTFPSLALRPVAAVGDGGGTVEVLAVTTGGPIDRVDFALDGVPVGSAEEPPYRVRLAAPTLTPTSAAPRTLTAVARAPDGAILARDRRVLERPSGPIAVRLQVDDGALIVDVERPPGVAISHVDVDLGSSPWRRLDGAAEFPARLTLPADSGPWARAVAVGADGERAEEMLTLDPSAFVERVDVRLVDVVVSVVDGRGRPITDLRADEVSLLVDGAARRLERFDRVDELPLRVGLLLDTSISMRGRMSAAAAAASRFASSLLRPDDRAALVTVHDDIRLRVPLTGSIDRLRVGLAGLLPRGGTRLWDALVAATTYLSSGTVDRASARAARTSRRALVVLSDGRDVGSDYGAVEVREHVESVGVGVYAIVLGASAPLERIARTSGGTAVPVTGGLDAAFERIEQELRSEYRLVVEAEPGEAGRVDVRVARDGARVRVRR